MTRINVLRPFLVLQCPITGIVSSEIQPIGKSLHEQKTLSCSEIVTDTAQAEEVQARLVFELIRLMDSGPPLSQRICDYLAKAEDKERDVWLRDDIRLAFLTVLYAGRGYDIPDVWAYYYYLGAHPKKIIPILVERAAKHAAMEAPPKKAAASERKPAQRKKAA